MKRGFTLIELILVILLLSIIAMISVPVVTNIIKDAKKNTYDQQIDSIIDAARTYMTKNPELLPAENEYDDYALPITDIQKAGLLESEDVVNPNYSETCVEDSKDNNEERKKCMCKVLNGTIYVNWDVESNKYQYTYEDNENCS